MKKLTFEKITAQRLPPEKIKSVERFPIYALLDDLRSLLNVGSIFRTADAVRLSKLYLTGITGCPPRKEIDKTALGAVETVPWMFQKNVVPLVRQLKDDGIQIVVMEHTTESKPFHEIRYHFPSCLIVGNEVWGVKNEIVNLADETIEIPMFGSKQSLNVTIAFGIAIYEMLFQYLHSRNTSFR